MAEPLRILQVGAGAMGRTWLHTIAASPDAELVGLVDLDLGLAQQASESELAALVPIARSLSELVDATGAQAVVNVTVPAAHNAVNEEALRAGLPVLCEKPIAPTVADAQYIAGVAEQTGQLLMISQSRRYLNQFAALRTAAGELGRIASVSCEFARAPHFGGFREEMPYPLLVDMAIHQFDAARALLGSDPVGVYCESYNPGWSWYAGDAAATAIFEFPGGARFVFHGSWCAPGQETSWNSRWRVSGEHGTALWDGDNAPVTGDPVAAVPVGDQPEQTAGSLAEFVGCVRSGAPAQSDARSNVASLAMVEAAVRSATERRRIELAEVLAASS
ncbi:oxidoreductase domain protein [Kribbella flavida DSM 17836]|uniref:Oxidoreductase domain protein n=1 Tax=Kribbella flavida (strain DSM 17836 / JCM 10339 / NBRC 14399) TaxID=479435 RepID=D2PUW7_KRIFD|nr:Gfo/Idh/MocA family oxidoreductase [Kribbella flavida]ADB31433.1 oxidoreductase domain protein [Kribbella flavida DSM 17836]